MDTAIANAQLGGGEGGTIDTDNLAITNSLTVGLDCTASGLYSVAKGSGTTASGNNSSAEGGWTYAIGNCSHAEGAETFASGIASHTEGKCTTAASYYQHVQGKYNIEDTTNRYAHIVGNGAYKEIAPDEWDNVYSNAHTLDWDGNAWFAKDVYVGGTSQDDANKLATESYVDNAINNIEIPEVNLTDYATKEELNNALGDIETLLGEI